MDSYSRYPVFHDLSLYSKIDLDLKNISVWEIPVPVADALWAIVLAYCCSAESDIILSKRLTKIGAERVGKKIRNSIKFYNPFLHRNTCFNDEGLIGLVDAFRKQVRKIYKTEDNNLEKIIQAASDLLSCKIVLFLDNWSSNTKNIEVFPNRDTQIYLDVIYIFSNVHTDKNLEGRCFSFGMLQKFSSQKRKSALKNILENADIRQNDVSIIIKQAFDSRITNFLLLTLKHCQSDCISAIYTSQYSLAKLKDAAFEIDPKKEDELGDSALFHSLKTKKTKEFYVLHGYAANACGSIRTPDSTTLKTLYELKEYFEQLHLKLDPECIPAEFEEICHFNDFLIHVCKSVQNNHCPGNSKLNEAENRRDVMLSILDSYDTYFSMTRNEGFSVYLKYGNYFDKLDFSAALLFFDNIFLLKERISLPDEKYSKVESQFLTYFYFKAFFNRFQREDSMSQLLYNFFLFHMRLVLQKEFNSFSAYLTSVILDENNLNECLPRSEVDTLKYSSEMHDEFIVQKIRYYLDAAISVKVKDIKSVMIIEKCLYVIGECITHTAGNDKIRKMLALALPKTLVQSLKKFRNKVTHSDRMSTSRVESEKDLVLYCRVQKELKGLQEILQPIFCSQTFWREQYRQQVLLEIIRQMQVMKFKAEDLQQMKIILSLNDSDIYSNLKELERLIKRQFDVYYNSVKDENVHVCNDEVYEKYCKYEIYKYLFCNIFEGVEKQVKQFKRNPFRITKLKDYFCCLEYLLQHIQNELREYAQKQFSEVLNNIIVILTSLNSSLHFEISFRKIEHFLLYQPKILTILVDHQSTSKMSVAIDFKYIKQLSCTVFLMTSEQKVILDSVPKRFKTSNNSILKSIKLLKSLSPIPCYFMSNNTLQSLLQNRLKDILNLKENDRDFILKNLFTNPEECIEKIIKVKDYYQLLIKVIDECEMNIADYNLLCSKLELTEYAKKLLHKIVKRGQTKDGNKLQFLRSRINHLKEILVDENKDVKLLWKISNSPKNFLYIQERIIQTYINDPNVQVSVEMLLFDCMNIMKPEKEEIKQLKETNTGLWLQWQYLVSLWRKSSNLLKGMCLRNVLAHGDPLLESVGSLLDKEDLPRELVTRMLQFVKDAETIDHMLEIMDEMCTDPKDFGIFMNNSDSDIGSNLSKLQEKIKADINWENHALKTREKIKKCPRWKDYSSLISYE